MRNDVSSHGQPNDREMVDMQLKAAFAAELRRTGVGLNDDIGLCRDEYYALFFARQQVYLGNLERYPKPQEIIAVHPDAAQFLEPLWQATCHAHEAFIDSIAILKEHWSNCPSDELPPFAENLTNKPQNYFNGLETRSIQVSATYPHHLSPSLRLWQGKERSFRGTYYRCFKEFIRSLRYYLEIVIDLAQSKEDHSLLQRVLRDNRNLRDLDALIPATVVERSIHFNQRPQAADKRDKRQRKVGGAPYSDHPVEAALFLNRHHTAHAMARDRLGASTPFLTTTISEPCHDGAEDSRYTVARVIGLLKQEINHLDNRWIELIQGTPSGMDIETFLNQVLPLMREFTDEKVLTAVFRITNKNTVLSEAEKIAALEKNIAGPAATCEMLGIALDIPTEEPPNLTDKERLQFSYRPGRALFAAPYRSRDIKKLKKPLNTFERFPVSHESKMDHFLLRLFSITDVEFTKSTHSLKKMAFHTSVLDKLGDRWHNTKHMDPQDYKYRLTTLRGNVTRLLAFIMLDLDRTKYPFYDTLPEFIDLTLAEYRKLRADWEGLPAEQKGLIDWQTCDDEYITQLEEWRKEVETYDEKEVLDPEVFALLELYKARALRAATPNHPTSATSDAVAEDAA